ncbi:rhomboid family intramembrane serine protease [Patescibacteria group bacterium]
MERLKDGFCWSLGVIVFIWIVYFIDCISSFDMCRLGIRPRDLTSFLGIFFAPFIHGNLDHLISNSFPLFFSLLIATTYYHKSMVPVILMITLAGGLGTLAFGSGNTIQIGASGIVMGLFGFLFSVGIYKRDATSIIISIFTITVFGGNAIASLIPTYGISWSGHFCGLIGGVLALKYA